MGLSCFRAISGLGLDGWDLCAGLFYEHRFAMLIISTYVGFMMEDGNMRGAAPECAGLGWVYYNGHCYLFDRYRSINYP